MQVLALRHSALVSTWILVCLQAALLLVLGSAVDVIFAAASSAVSASAQSAHKAAAAAATIHPPTASYNDDYHDLSEAPRKTYQAFLSGGGASGSKQQKEEDSHIMCYTCHFHVQKGHSQGMENCRDPFLKSGIPQVPCQGPCGKIYRRLSANGDNNSRSSSKSDDADEYMIIRNCVPNCKDLTDDKGFTSCCSDKLCNSATRLCGHHWTLFVTALIVSCSVLSPR